jgi:hypothetical protein
MKGEEEHQVPLTDEVLQILLEMSKLRESCVFPGNKGKHLGNMAMLMTRRRMGFAHITVHGFRSTFRTWAEECTEFQPILAEMALSHSTDAAKLAGVDPSLWRAYQRGKLVERRRPLMVAWTNFVTLGEATSPPSNTPRETLLYRGGVVSSSVVDGVV